MAVLIFILEKYIQYISVPLLIFNGLHRLRKQLLNIKSIAGRSHRVVFKYIINEQISISLFLHMPLGETELLEKW